MTKRQIKKMVLRGIAQEIIGHLGSCAGYMYDEIDDDDVPRLEACVMELSEEFGRRGRE